MGRRGMVAIVAVLAAGGGAEAAPFVLGADGTGQVWVLDAASGATRLCRTVARSGPKVIDAYGNGAEPRVTAGRPGCVLVLPAPEAALALPVRGMLGDGSSGPQVGSAAGMLGTGDGGAPWGQGSVVVVVPRAAAW